MWPQGYFRVHSRKSYMTTVIFTRSHRIEQIVIYSYKSFSSVRVFPNPILKGLFYHFLLTLSNSGFTVKTVFCKAQLNHFCYRFFIFNNQYAVHNFPPQFLLSHIMYQFCITRMYKVYIHGKII